MFDFLLVFFLTAISDAVWTYYIQASSSKQTAKAVVASGVIVLVGSLVTLEVVDDRWMLIPMVLGAMAGTFATMVGSSMRAKARGVVQDAGEA